MSDYAIYKTKVGYIKIVHDNGKVIGLHRVNEEHIIDYGHDTEFTKTVMMQLKEYLEGNRETFEIPYEVKGTVFQKKVWKALCDIPYGETRTYKEIAIAVGNEKASRAVGMANNKNPIAIVIPCHRVIGANGKLVGYAGGLDMKEMLLKLEYKKNKTQLID